MDELWVPLVNLAILVGWMLFEALCQIGEEQERQAVDIDAEDLARERREGVEPRSDIERILRRQIP